MMVAGVKMPGIGSEFEILSEYFSEINYNKTDC